MKKLIAFSLFSMFLVGCEQSTYPPADFDKMSQDQQYKACEAKINEIVDKGWKLGGADELSKIQQEDLSKAKSDCSKIRKIKIKEALKNLSM